jgi:hypothetical protein
MVRLENDELVYSLKLQEKLKKILLDEINRLREGNPRESSIDISSDNRIH